MRLVIDGYNLLRHDQWLNRMASRGLTQAREELLRRLESYRVQRGHSIEVVFDGWGGSADSPEKDRYGGVDVVYSPAGKKADDIIMEKARMLRDGIVVVTSDRAVADFALSQGAAVVSAGDFEERMRDALYAESKSVTGEEEEGGPAKTKGPSRTPRKKERKSRQALKKL